MPQKKDGSRRFALIACAVAALLAAALPTTGVAAQDETTEMNETRATVNDGPAYYISTFNVDYVRPNPMLPPVSELMEHPIRIGKRPDGYVAPRAGEEIVEIRLSQFKGPGVERFYASGLQAVLEGLRDAMSEANLLGVFVAPDPQQISPMGVDYRQPGARSLNILITVGVVSEMRTLSSGARVPMEERVNHPLHSHILRTSPIQPGPDVQPPKTNLIRRDLLDNFIFLKSRHPGRRVEVAVAPSDETGGVSLDYLVSENKPWVIYAQISNTGTEQTDRLRERFGLFHSQLTENDDIFSFDYTTANFDDYHALNASYEFPVFYSDRWRLRVFGDWSDYTASDVGIFETEFSGSAWTLGAEMYWNFYQQREFFLDAIAGIKYRDVSTDNELTRVDGDESFVIPYIGARFDRTTDWFSTFGSAVLEFNASGNEDDMEELGRFDPDERWAVLRWNVNHAFYLEPLLNPEGWRDPSTPESSTLAHEIYASARGQYAFGNRLIPQEQDVLGGLYSVRGYDQSIVAGDSSVVGTLEYRFHVPRALSVQPEPRELFGEPFRAAPQYVYGLPDWDLILRSFIDIGRTWNHDALSFEEDETLIGAGVGAEFIFKRNLNLRVDWGFALRDVDSADVDSGSNTVHFVATFLF